MELTYKTESWGRGKHDWLASKHGTDTCETVTLEVGKFASFKATHGDTIPAGIPLKQGTDGMYEPVKAAGDEIAGFLYTAQPNKGEKQAAPMLWHGRVFTDLLPEGSFDVTTLTAKPSLIGFTKKGGAN